MLLSRVSIKIISKQFIKVCPNLFKFFISMCIYRLLRILTKNHSKHEWNNCLPLGRICTSKLLFVPSVMMKSSNAKESIGECSEGNLYIVRVNIIKY